VGHPETVPLHDILWHLDQALADADTEAVPVQLGRLSRWVARVAHPELPAVKVLLGVLADDGALLPEAMSVEDLLAARGLMAQHDDPVAAIERCLAQHAEVERTLEVRIRELEQAYLGAARTANVLAGVGALLLGGVVVLLLVSTGVIEVRWMDAPTLEESTEADQPEGP